MLTNLNQNKMKMMLFLNLEMKDYFKERDKLKVTKKYKTNQALSAVFKMLKQNLSLDNNNLNLKK